MTKLTRKTWWLEVGYRTLKTMAQTALSMITVGNLVTEMDWLSIGSVTLVSGVACILTQFATLPDLESGE